MATDLGGRVFLRRGRKRIYHEVHGGHEGFFGVLAQEF
jgi:hypothetical protein